jgi:hypothetical protein
MLPFLTAYDPPGSSEGTLDPVGLYQVADQLATQLVPAVRERMLRVRFLTAMAVGSLLCEELEADREHPNAAPYLVWEWLIVEAIVRSLGDEPVTGVAGTLVATRARKNHGYLDARSYLKTPRIFGFHGIYKRLAIQLGIVDVHLGPGRNSQKLVEAWAKSQDSPQALMKQWRDGLRRSLEQRPPRTNTGWTAESWSRLAQAFNPEKAGAREKRLLTEWLHGTVDMSLGALAAIWKLQEKFPTDADFREERLHDALEKTAPEYRPLLKAIRHYERFSRRLQDGFDILRAEATARDDQGFQLPDVAKDKEFCQTAGGVGELYEKAYLALGDVTVAKVSLQALFSDRFQAFAPTMKPSEFAMVLCSHHEQTQTRKSAEGKRPWFHRLGEDRIFIRHSYRTGRQVTQPARYLHEYRGWPIRRFRKDLS